MEIIHIKISPSQGMKMATKIGCYRGHLSIDVLKTIIFTFTILFPLNYRSVEKVKCYIDGGCTQ